jgi:pyridoxine 5-phosphate synthase
MTDFACRLRPAAVCLVPESRDEVTTEGGLEVAGQRERVAATVAALKGVGIEVSLFIGADAAQIEAAHAVGAPVVELHTGAFANAWLSPTADEELARLRSGCELAHRLGLIVNAGHGINYYNISAILSLPHLNELNIGHTIVARSLLTGARAAVAEMKDHLLRGA